MRSPYNLRFIIIKNSHYLHRNGLINRKYRRHINDLQHQQQSHKAGPRRAHPGTFSSSQLSIEVSELHADANNRLEITCISTIPASVGPGEQYADYKTYSVKGKQNLLWSTLLQYS